MSEIQSCTYILNNQIRYGDKLFEIRIISTSFPVHFNLVAYDINTITVSQILSDAPFFLQTYEFCDAVDHIEVRQWGWNHQEQHEILVSVVCGHGSLFVRSVYWIIFSFYFLRSNWQIIRYSNQADITKNRKQVAHKHLFATS